MSPCQFSLRTPIPNCVQFALDAKVFYCCRSHLGRKKLEVTVIWVVTGADGNTGKERRVEIAAENEAAAIAGAKAKGLFVSSVKPRGPIEKPSTSQAGGTASHAGSAHATAPAQSARRSDACASGYSD